MGKSQRIVFALVSTGVLTIASSRAGAAILEVRAIVDGNPLLTVLDQGAGDNNPTVGIIGIGTTSAPAIVGGLQLFAQLSISSSPGTATLSQLSHSGLNIVNTSGASHTAVLQVSDAGFTLPASPLDLSASASGTFAPVPGTATTTVDGTTARARAWADNTNTKFGTQFLVQDFTATPAAGLGLFSYANSAAASNFTYPTNYAMTVQLDFTLPNNTQLNGHSDVIQAIPSVPEPAAASAVAIAGVVIMRRRRK